MVSMMIWSDTRLLSMIRVRQRRHGHALLLALLLQARFSRLITST